MTRALTGGLCGLGLCLLLVASLRAQPVPQQTQAEPTPEQQQPDAGVAAPAPPGPPASEPSASPVAPAPAAAPPSAAPAAPQVAPTAPGPGGPVIELDEEAQASPEASAEPSKPAEPSAPGPDTLIERTVSHESGVTLGGYGEHEFVAAEGQDTRFRNHRYVVFVYARIGERISSATEIEFEWAGSPLKKDGVLGPGEVLLEFSVLDFRVAEWLVLRAGVILVPFGSYNLNHDAPSQDLAERPIAYTSVIPTTWFESGAGVLGKIALGEQRIGYELYVVNGLDARIADGFGMRAARGSHFEDNNNDKALVGRLSWSPTLDVEIGLSGYTGEYDKLDNRVNMANLDLKLRLGDLEVQAEAGYAFIDPGYVQGFPPGSEANTREPVPTGMWGYYAQLNYHFRIEPLFRLFPEDMQNAVFTACLRYEGKDTDVDRHSALGDQRRLTAGLNFRPIEQLVLKSDFQWNSKGEDLEANAPEFWQGDFWDGRDAGFLFDSYVASVAYLF